MSIWAKMKGLMGWNAGNVCDKAKSTYPDQGVRP